LPLPDWWNASIRKLPFANSMRNAGGEDETNLRNIRRIKFGESIDIMPLEINVVQPLATRLLRWQGWGRSHAKA
jgi:hypothetical protein